MFTFTAQYYTYKPVHAECLPDGTFCLTPVEVYELVMLTSTSTNVEHPATDVITVLHQRNLN